MTSRFRTLLLLTTFALVAVTPLHASESWTTNFDKDPMSGKRRAFASSPSATSLNEMSAALTTVKGKLLVACDSEDEWVGFKFNSQPNLTDTDTKDGFNVVNTRIKWDTNLSDITLIQKWGGKGLHFPDGAEPIEKIRQNRSVLLELNWYGHGTVHFKFTLNGSAQAVAEIRQRCFESSPGQSIPRGTQ